MIYSIDILDTTSRDTPVIYVVQGDTARSLQFELKDYTIPTGATVKYYVEKPSGQAVYNSCTVSDNVVTVPLTAQALAETGENKLQVRVEKNSTVITSFTVVLNVKPFGGMNAVQSTTEANVFDQVMAEMLEDIEDAAEDAETYISQSIDATLSITDKAADAKATGDALALKADKSGTEEELTAGTALQLLSDTVTENADPYLYRPTPTGAGDREMGDIAGASVGWNQLAQNGNFESTTGWIGRYANVSASSNVMTVTPTSNGGQRGLVTSDSPAPPNTEAGHKYLLSIEAQSPINGTIELSLGGTVKKYVSVTASTWKLCQAVWTSDTVYLTRLYALLTESLTTSQSLLFKNAQIVDLTAMLGSTIADYVATLETATAGSGIAWLKQYGYFTDAYYAYSAPTMQSVTGLSAKKTVGKNQFGFDIDSVDAVNATRDGNSVRVASNTNSNVWKQAKYKLPVPIADTSYTVSISGTVKSNSAFDPRIYVIDESGSNVAYFAPGSTLTTTFTIPAGRQYRLMFRISQTGNPQSGEYVTFLEPMVRFTSAPEAFEPHEEHTYPLDSSVVLRGIVKKDANNRMYYDGDTYEHDGTVRRRYAELTNQTGAVGATITLTGAKSNLTELMSSAGDLSEIGTISGTTLTLTKALSGDSIVYEKATPTTESADPFQEIMLCDGSGTEEYLLADGTTPVPVGGVTKYPADLKAELERVRAAVPAVPASNGTYTLKAVRSNSGVTYSWTT